MIVVPIGRKTIKQADQLAKISMLYQQLGNYLVHLILPSVVLRSDITGEKSPLAICHTEVIDCRSRYCCWEHSPQS